MQAAYYDKMPFTGLNEEKESSFKKVYDDYWPSLYRYAYNIIRNKEVCEEIVQETFFSLWNKLEELRISHSLQAYLFTAVKFQTLNYIKSEKVRSDYATSFTAYGNLPVDNSNEENIHFADLKNHLEIEISKLPKKCQQIFRMSRNEHQSIKNISDLLSISHKTVENQLSKALKHLRTSLGDFLLLFIAFIITQNNFQ